MWLTLFSHTLCLVSIFYSHYISPSNLAQALFSGFSSHSFSSLVRVLPLFQICKKWLLGWNIMVISVLLKRISYLFFTCWYFKSHRILYHCYNPLCLHPSPDHIQDKVGVMNTSRPTGRQNPTTRSYKRVKPKYNKRAHSNRKKGDPRASRQGDQRDHTTESQRTPTIEVHPTDS